MLDVAIDRASPGTWPGSAEATPQRSLSRTERTACLAVAVSVAEKQLEAAMGVMMDMPRHELAQAEKMPLAKPKGTVKTIECPDTGETIHCVDILRQPSFDQPLMKNHILRISPDSSPKSYEALVSEGKFVQACWKYGECPEGTVPIAASKGTPTLKKSHPSWHFNKRREPAKANLT